MKIMYISHERKMGGANLCLFELAKEMQRRGHEITVVVLHKGCSIDTMLKKSGIKVFYCFFGWWQQPKMWSPILKVCFRFLHTLQFISRIRISKYVIKNQIDIIHSNSSCIDIGMQVSVKTGIKHVWHFREYGDEDYNLEYIYGRLRSIQYINQNKTAVIFISSVLREAYLDIITPNIQVIHDGVDDRYILNKKIIDTNKSHYTFLIAGNLNPNKNQKLILKAAVLLRDRDVKNINILIAGDSTDLLSSRLYKEQLLSFILEEKLENVKLLGYVEDMNSLRKDTDAEIVPSVSEAFGRVTVEAMLGKNVVIVSDAGANTELVENGRTGLVFESNNAQDLANKMEYLVKDAELENSLRTNAFILAKKKYTIKQNADQIERLYFNLMGEKNE